MMTRVQHSALAIGLVLTACSGDGGTPPASVDREPPSVSLTADRSMVTTAGNVLLSATASDSSGVVRVEFYEQLVGVDASPRVVSRDSVLPYQHLRPFLSSADDGTHEFTARAYDPAGNVGSSLRTSVVVAMAPVNDDTPPTVTATIPNDGATGVAVDATISATFSEPLHPLSITSASFTVRPGVTGTVTYTGTTATFVPATPLALGTAYTATLSTAVRDVAGNPLASPYLWTFTTRSSSPSGTFATVHPGFFYTCGVKTGGDGYCWGQNDAGQLGDGTTTVRLTPVGVLGGLSFTSVTAARQGYHSCGVTAGGSAYCWGDNAHGQLGDGTTAQRRSPITVLGGHSFASVGTGRSHSCGVTTEGAAYCWGDNASGQLGDGTTTQRRSPVAVAGGLTFAMVSVGAYHTCGVTTAGTAYCWGGNGGALGDGTTTDRASPVAVQGGRSYAMVSAGGTVSCGVTTGGAAYCWGDNFFGALGNGTTSPTPETRPVAVIGGLTFVSVSVSVSHVCGLTTEGKAHCWGSNYSGQLGDGTTIRRTSPVAVVGGLVFSLVRVGDGGGCTCGVTVERLAYCWGDNFLGQLGNGTTDESSVPVKVAGQP